MPSDAFPKPLVRFPSGVPGLDTLLGGGFLTGGLYIIQGQPGVGKTTFANQVCFRHVAGGGRALYVTLLAEYHARMFQHLGSMSFFDPARVSDGITYLNGLDALHSEGLTGLLALLRREVASGSASVLVIDGIVSAKRRAKDDQAFNEFVHELQAIAIATDCTVFLLTSSHGNAEEPEQTMVDGIIQLNDELTGWSAASSLQVIKFRGYGIVRGRHAFRITDDGIVVYPRLELVIARPSRSDQGSRGRTGTGIDELDKMLGGGLPSGSTTMVIGPSGIGKTTLGLHFLSCCKADKPGLLFGFYETPARIEAKVAAVCPGLGALMSDGHVRMIWEPPTDDLLDRYGERLLDAINEHGVNRLFIDGLGGFKTAAVIGGSGRLPMFLTALTNELRVLGVTTVYTTEVPEIEGPTVRPPIGDLSGLAENLIMLRYVEKGPKLHRLISVLKVRDSLFDEGLREFRTSDHGLVIDATSEGAEAVMAGRPIRLTGGLASFGGGA